MKAKTARRWLVRNQVANTRKELAGIKTSKFERRCIKVIREDAKHNEASKRIFNQFIMKNQ